MLSSEELEIFIPILRGADCFDGRIGASKLSKILAGSSDESVERFTSSPVFGQLSGVKSKTIQDCIQNLERNGYLDRIDRSGYPCLSISGAGKAVLRGSAALLTDTFPARSSTQAVKSTPKTAAPRKKTASPPPPSAPTDLRGMMYELRRRIAEERHVPLYVIFSNDVLDELIRIRPRTAEEAMAKIKGIGPAKAATFLPSFLFLLEKMQEQ